MSCTLPPEIFDLVIDQLHDEPTTLKACCIVSKSWIPRTRRHLFAHVKFGAEKHLFASWMKTFPDPSKSPAHHTRSLTIHRFLTVVTTDTGVADCVRTFRNVVRLHFSGLIWASRSAPLVPFHGFSHTVRSLRLTNTSFEVFNLVCSFPLLEDLALLSLCPWSGTARWSPPSTSPKLTGSLKLSSIGGIRFAIHRLLDFPDGLHFANIMVSCFSEDSESTVDLVSRCSGTLESLRIHSFVPGVHSLDLSKTTKLKDLTFQGSMSSIRWIIAILQTVESKNLQQITIYPYSSPLGSLAEQTDHQEWQDLDRLLVQFWTSHSIRPQLMYSPDDGGRGTRDHAQSLLPGLTRRGLVDLVEVSPPP